MSTPVSAPPVEGPPGPGSFLSRFAGVFFSPRETFADIARNPGFIVPLIIVVVLSVAATEAFLAKIGIEPVMRWALEHSSRTANMTPEQIQQTMSGMVRFQTILAHVAGVLWIPFVTLIVAVIGLVTVKSIFGADLSFKTAFSVAAYAYLVNLIYEVMAVILVFVGDPEHAISNPQNLAPSSLGFFLNPVDTSKPLMALGGSLEIFTIWYLVLLGIGFSEASARKAKFSPVFGIFFGLWVVMVLAKMALSTLG
jgi:Yip1-like protein